MKDSLNFAVIGLGQRGKGLLENILIAQSDVNIVGVCDAYSDRAEEGGKFVKEKRGVEPLITTDYKEIFGIKDLDCVLISTAWEYHLKIAIYAMKKGVAVALEVGGAFSMEELWELVRVQEQTGTPFMFMENCCFDKGELLATNMARHGLFGDVVHLEGAYSHDLRCEVSSGMQIRHYRLRNYIHRNCENYPTHEIGPIAKLIDINRGNRFVSLVSVASKAEGLKRYVKDNAEKFPELVGQEFKQGDVVTTVITCANGETVTIKLDTTLPRFYSRNFTVRGTKGMYSGDSNLVYLDGDEEGYDTLEMHRKFFDNGKKYEEKYLPDFWKTVTKEQLEAGHGGIDYFEFRCLVDCLKKGEEPPIDVYDAATWMAISILSEESIQKGGAPVTFPDFTDGKWMLRERKDVCEFRS